MCTTCGCQNVSEITVVQPQAVQPSPADVIPAGQPGGYDVQPVAQPAPVQPAPVEAQPAAVPQTGATDAVNPLITALDMVPQDSPQAAEILDIIHTEQHLPDTWLRPSHDIYGNDL